MRFSYKWLQELVPELPPPSKLARILTLYLAETEVYSSRRRVILDVDLLPNRVADLSGHLGLAREIGAILGRKVSLPKVKLPPLQYGLNDFLKIKIQSPNCSLYVCSLIRGVKVKQSPLWLRKKLEDCGLRSINNIVDATNYVMLLTGQPLHAFDYDKISSPPEIIIRQARQGEKIVTLEKKAYSLDEQIMVIADAQDPIAIAGIKGGEKAEVDLHTKNIVLESANFFGPAIRRASQKLKLRTDASWRFEHSLTPELAQYGMEQLLSLITQIAGGEIITDKSWQKRTFASGFIPVKWEKWEKFLGWRLTSSEIKRYLRLLGFSIKSRKKYLLVSPPCFRNDIQIAEDVMGEVARLYGLDNIKSVPPVAPLTVPPKNELWEFKEELRNWLRGYHLEEVYNYSLISQEETKCFPSSWKKVFIEVSNPVSNRFAILRPTLLCNLLRNVAYNFNFVSEVRFFEIGKRYYRDKKYQERTVFAGVLASKEEKEKDLFYQVKGLGETLFQQWGLTREDYFQKKMEQSEYKDIFVTGVSFSSSNNEIGIVAAVPQKWLQFYDIKGSVVFWEFDLERLLALINTEREFQPLPRFPAVIRDISLFVPQGTSIERIVRTIQKAAPRYLEDVDLFDIYEEKVRETGKYSASFHLVFRSPEKTLTAAEVEAEMKKIYKALTAIKAVIR